MSEFYSTTESDLDIGTEELTEQLAINKSLREQNEKLTRDLMKLNHDSEIKINDLEIKIEVLEKKNKSLNEYLEEIKSSNNSEFQKNEKNDTESELIIKYENYIHDLESLMNLSSESKMELERKNNELINEVSLLKLEISKLNINVSKLRNSSSEISIEKESIDASEYEEYPESIKNLLIEKDVKIQEEISRFNNYESEVIEIISEDMSKNFMQLKSVEEEKNSLSEKLREISNELLTKKKEFEEYVRENEINPKIRQGGSQNKRTSSFPNEITTSDSKRENEDDAQSFNSEEVGVLVEKCHELEYKYNELKDEYETKKESWEFESRRLENYYIDSEISLKSRIDDLTRMNESLRKEIQEIESIQHKSQKNDEEANNWLVYENEDLNKRIVELEDHLNKTENNNRDKIAMMKKEINEVEESKIGIINAKEQLAKELNTVQNTFSKREKELQDKHKIEVNLKLNEIIQMQTKIESLSRESETRRNDLNLAKINYDKLNVAYENLNENHNKITQNNKKEIERIKEEKEKLKKGKEFEITQLKNSINDLKEKLIEKDNIITANLNENNKNGESALENLLLISDNEKVAENLKAEILHKEEKINELSQKIDELNKLIKTKENLEEELGHANAKIIQQSENLKSQKEIYEKQISQLMQKTLDINADLLSQKRRTTSIRTEANFNPKQMAVFAEMDMSIKKLSAENKYLKDQLEISQSEMEKIKNLRETDINYFKQELLNAEKTAVEAKIAVASMAFDKDCEIVKYKNMCKKLRLRLGNIPPPQNVKNKI